MSPRPTTASSTFSTSTTTTARRIRFAPLPDPHTLNEGLDDAQNSFDTVEITKPVVGPIDTTCIPESTPYEHDISDRFPGASESSSQSWSRPRSFSLFRSFPFRPKVINLLRPFPFTSSSSPHTPNTPLDSAPPQSPAHATPKNKKDPSRRSTWGFFNQPTSPGSRSRVDSSPTVAQPPDSPSKPKFSKRRASSVASFTSSPATTRPCSRPSSRSGPGIPMLNGRVYGGSSKSPRHKVNVNPFANIPDQEPEFVEWGYGGMGSVSGGKHAGVIGGRENKDRPRWERLHSPAASESPLEEDDGSGIAWIKKRREQRERQEREKAEREKADQADSHQGPSGPDVVDGVNRLSSDAPTIVPDPPASPSTLVPATSPADASFSKVETPTVTEHTLSTTVNLPASSPRYRQSISRSISPERAPTTNRSMVSLVSPGITPSTPRPTPTRCPSSDSDSDSDDGEEKQEDEDEDDDDEYEREDAKRKTALGAGLERISRHNN